MSAKIQALPTVRRSPVRDVQDSIKSVERSIDETLAGNSQLLAKMIAVGGEARLAPGDGQQAIQRVAEAVMQGVRWRAMVIAAHQDLHAAFKKMDVRELGWGGMGDSPTIEQDAVDAMLREAGVERR